MKRSYLVLAALIALATIGSSHAASLNDSDGDVTKSTSISFAFSRALDSSPCLSSTYPMPSSYAVTIVADPGEAIGDPAVVSYCVGFSGRTSIASPSYQAVAGWGSNASTASCAQVEPYVPIVDNRAPAQLAVNPGPSQRTVYSQGPVTIRDGQTYASGQQCGQFAARIGDVIGGDLAMFIALSGPAVSGATEAGYAFELQMAVMGPGTPVPALSEWMLLVLGTLLVLTGGCYGLHRRAN